MPTEKNRKKKKKFLTLFVFVLLAFSLFNFFSARYEAALAADTGNALANTAQSVDSLGSVVKAAAGFGAMPFFWAINLLLYMIFGLMGVILVIAGILFDWAINPANFEAVMKMQSIYQAWTIVRDFLNLAFILVLLYSAFCTVLQIEKYHLKKIILTLVLMALLVNFSFPVARFIIDTSNVTMYYIIGKAFPWVSESTGVSTSIVQFSGIIFALVPGANCGSSGWVGKIGCFLKATWKNVFDAQHVTVQLLGSIIFMFLLAITLLAIGVLLIIRIVVLAILIIFSPVGFVAPIFPSTSNFGNMWWDNLFKQAFFGPVMAFMVYISLFMMKEIQENDVGKMSNFVFGNLGTGNSYSSLIISGVMLAIPIILLWTGLIAAQKIGAAGASAVIGKASSIAKWPAQMMGKAASYGIHSGLKKFDRDVLVKSEWAKKTAEKIGLPNLSPRSFVDAWKKRAQEVEDRTMRPSAGKWQDKLNKTFDKSATNNYQLETDRLTMQRVKDYKEVSEESEYVNSNISALMGSKDQDARARLKGLFRILYGNNDQDELMDFIRGNLDKKILPGGKSFGDLTNEKGEKLFDKNNTTVSGENVSNAVEQILKMSGAEDDEINKELLDLGNIAAVKGGIGFGAVKYNSENGKFERVTEKGQQGYSTAAKMMTITEAQGLPKIMHRNNFTDQDSDGAKLNEGGKALLRKYTNPAAVEHIGRHKNDFYTRVGADANITRQMYDYAAALKNGTADGYDPNAEYVDPKTGKTKKGKHVENLKDEKQAKMAVTWIASLQGTSGISEEEIKKGVESAGYSWSEIKPLTKIAKLDKGSEKGEEGGRGSAKKEESGLVDQFGRPIK